MKGLFFEDNDQVNSSFKVFNKSDCIRKFIHPQGMEFDFSKLNLWRLIFETYQYKEESAKAIEDIAGQIPSKYYNCNHWDWLRISSNGVNSELQENFLEILNPKKERKYPFVKNVGAFKINRSAIPFIKRTGYYGELIRILSASEEEDDYSSPFYSSFGTYLVGDQSKMHFPFSVNPKEKIKINCNGLSKKIIINELTYYVSVKCRIHLYPYGLVIPQILISITPKYEYPLNNQILLNRIIMGDEKSYKISFDFKKKSFPSVKALLKYLEEMCILSISSSKETAISSEIYSFQTLRTNEVKVDAEDYIKSKILKILNNDSVETSYSNSYLNDQNSIFGRYKNDFVFVSGRNCVVSMEDWLRSLKRDNKLAIRYYWSFIHLYQFVVSSKFIIKQLTNHIEQNPTKSLERIHSYYRFVNSQSRSLSNSGFRLLYHQLERKSGLDEDILTLIKQIKIAKNISSKSYIVPKNKIPNSIEDNEDFRVILGELIASNNISECFDVLKTALEYDEFRKDIILLESQWNSIQSEKRSGLIKPEDEFYLSNKIKKALLFYI